ncbi:putative het domain protein [Phaeomoniella chlamydospora]|uniref:Putative het domain protein n=1 Tax=Phaeomoniella chlamydospora TaxID=158046 RepID=A0A0G2GK79_PHACM|nr:putative het domain protein [Phaeomoniella chlamydospora]
MLQQRFATGGYCQYEVEMIFDIFENNFTALYVGSQIERPYSRLVLGHGKCDANHCVALNTDSRTYQQRHSRDCKDRGDCNPVFVDMNSIVQVIENDDVPIVSIAEDIHGNPQLRIIPMSEARDRYVAVSHVWAHGRGNPNANALPVCQLWSLVHVLRKLIGVKSVLQPCEFWIDTLCIPVGAEHKILRKRAIEKIDMVFRESRSVLVLDADLELSQSPMSPTELALRVITSGWVRRLWTLSEAVLSRDGYGTQKLLFAFLDGIKSFDSIFELSNSERNELSRSDNSKILTAFAYLFPLNVDRNQRFPNVLDFLGSLEYRSTSRIEDEPLCLSSIVGYDIPRILQYNTHEERMRELYLMMKTVPVSILSHRRERLNIRGFSWAPYSFMSGKAKEWNIHVTSRQQQDIQAAEVTTAGLILPPTTKIVHIDPSTITDLTTNNNNYYYSYYSTYQNQPRYMYSIPNVDPNPSTQKFHSIGLPPNNNITSPTADFFISFMTQTVYQQQINLFISSCRSSNTNKPYTPAIILHTSRFNKNEGLLVGIYKTPEPPIPKEKHKPTPGDTTRTDNMGNGIRILLHRCFYFCRVYLWPHSETELKSVGNGTILGTTILDDKVKEDSGIRYIIE